MFYEIHMEAKDKLPFVLTSIGSLYQTPVHRKTGFHSHLFIWITKGEGHFEVEGDHFTLGVGEGVFLRSDISYCYEGEDLYTSWFTFTVPEGTLEYMGVPHYLRFKVPSFLYREYDQLYRFAVGSNSTLLSRSSAGYTLTCELFSAILSNNESLSARIEQFLENHYSQPLSLDDIAAFVNIDRFSLCRVFMRERGMTVMDQLLLIRIEKAKKMLKYTAEPINRIALSCGFESPCYFTKRFRLAVGCTPSQYRKNS